MAEDAEERYWNAPFAEAEAIGDIEESFRIVEEAARNGDKDAAFLLGQEYGIYARPGWQDLEKAYKWFEKASNLGDVSGTYEQGIALLKGLGVAPSQGLGLAKIREAATLGNEMALNRKPRPFPYHSTIDPVHRPLA